ncbi:MAG: 23S rRNA (pseudouridine(1915)-N(3))-methyltransferase RlmH, partial [Bacilli bacterium]
MKIRLLVIGKIKEKYLKEGINEYLIRLKPYAQIDIVEVNDESVRDNATLSDIEIAKNKEGQKILKF